MLILRHLRHARTERKVTAAAMIELTGIDADRYKAMEKYSTDKVEPFYHEAAVIAQVLNLEGINPLILLAPANSLSDLDLGKSTPLDIDQWRSGLPIALSVACRVTQAFGLTDPHHLTNPPVTLRDQITEPLANGERTVGLGMCAWCAQPPADHLPTCLLNNVLGVRARYRAPNITYSSAPRFKGGPHGFGNRGKGLKALRLAQGLTQREMAEVIDVSSDYYAKMERCEQNILVEKAKVLADTFGVELDVIYLEHEVLT